MSHWYRDRTVIVLSASLAILVVLEALFARHYRPVFPWHHVPGYAGAIGLFGCLIVVIAAKALGRWVLQRPEPDED